MSLIHNTIQTAEVECLCDLAADGGCWLEVGVFVFLLRCT